MSKFFQLFLLLNSIFFTFEILEDDTNYDLTLNITDIYNTTYSEESVIIFQTNSTEIVDIYESDIENEIFDSYFIQKTEEELNISAKCFLWKPKEENIFIFCKTPNRGQKMGVGHSYIKLAEFTITYKEKTIKILSHNFFEIDIEEGYTPFLYGEKQIIDFNDDQNIYELKFKIGLYRETVESFQIFSKSSHIKNYINLKDDCEIEGKELLCKIYKDQFEGYLLTSEEYFVPIGCSLMYGIINFVFIRDIIIKYNVNKENIYVNISKLLNSNVNNKQYATYETNITQISEGVSNIFYLNFTSNSDKKIIEQKCLFKKYKDDINMLLLCQINSEKDDEYFLNLEGKEIKFENIHVKYNFIISSENSEIITYKKNDNSGFLYTIDRYILNYTKPNAYYFTIFGSEGMQNRNGLTFGSKLKKLECDFNYNTASCQIFSTYFKDQKNGSYYLYENNNGGLSRIYELPPVKVILPDDSDDSRSYSEKLYMISKSFALLLWVFIL